MFKRIGGGGGGGGQRLFEQCSKKLHFSLMMASLISKRFLVMIVDQGANHGDPLGAN